MPFGNPASVGPRKSAYQPLTTACGYFVSRPAAARLCSTLSGSLSVTVSTLPATRRTGELYMNADDVRSLELEIASRRGTQHLSMAPESVAARELQNITDALVLILKAVMQVPGPSRQT
jgi:hypothetical protein